jgi:hypothetical protein
MIKNSELLQISNIDGYLFYRFEMHPGVEFCSVRKANQVGLLPLTSRKASVSGHGRRLGMQLLPWAEASLVRSALYPLLRLSCYLHPALPHPVCPLSFRFVRASCSRHVPFFRCMLGVYSFSVCIEAGLAAGELRQRFASLYNGLCHPSKRALIPSRLE